MWLSNCCRRGPFSLSLVPVMACVPAATSCSVIQHGIFQYIAKGFYLRKNHIPYELVRMCMLKRLPNATMPKDLRVSMGISRVPASPYPPRYITLRSSAAAPAAIALLKQTLSSCTHRWLSKKAEALREHSQHPSPTAQLLFL